MAAIPIIPYPFADTLHQSTGILRDHRQSGHTDPIFIMDLTWTDLILHPITSTIITCLIHGPSSKVLIGAKDADLNLVSLTMMKVTTCLSCQILMGRIMRKVTLCLHRLTVIRLIMAKDIISPHSLISTDLLTTVMMTDYAHHHLNFYKNT